MSSSPPFPLRPAPRKSSAVVTPKTLPAPPPLPLPRQPHNPFCRHSPPPNPSHSRHLPAPPKPPSESVAAQAKQEAVKSPTPPPQGKFYAIQIGSFREMENVSRPRRNPQEGGVRCLLDHFKKQEERGLIQGLCGTIYGYHEATQFQKDKTILKNYPDSFVQEISSPGISP